MSLSPFRIANRLKRLFKPLPPKMLYATIDTAAPSVVQGASVDIAIVARMVSFSDTVVLAVTDLPTGVTGVFTPASLGPNSFNAILQLTAAANAPAISNDSFTITLTGPAGVPVVTLTPTITVTIPNVPGAITVSASPTATSAQQGSVDTTTVTITRTAFTDDVTLSASGLPAGASVSFSPNPLTGATLTSTATVTNTLAAATVSNDPWTIFADGTGVTQQSQAMTHSITAIGTGAPSPDSGTIILDTRAGGNSDIQAAANYTAARTALLSQLGGAANTNNVVPNIPFTGHNSGWEFSTDIDGAGTHAFVSNLPGWGERLLGKTVGSRSAGVGTGTAFNITVPANTFLAANTRLMVQRSGAGNYEAAETATDATADGAGAIALTLKAANANSWGNNVDVFITPANSDAYQPKGYYRELGNKFYLNLQNRAPTELFVQYKLCQGRKVGGPGFDYDWRSSGPDRSSVEGEFVVQNEELFYDGTAPSSGGQNASRKVLLMTRHPLSLGGGGRYDEIFTGGVTTGTAGVGTVDITYNAGTDTGTATFTSSQTLTAGKLIRVGGASNQHLYEIVSGSGTSFVIKSRYLKARLATSMTNETFWITDKRTLKQQINSNKTSNVPNMPNTPGSAQQSLGGTTFRMEDAINQDITFTRQIVASSSETAADGIYRIWADDELILEATNLAYGNYAFGTLELFGSTFNSPRQNQTEYYWDLVMWTP